MLLCCLYIFFGEYVCQVFCLFKIKLFLFLLFYFKNSLCILDNSPVSDRSLANISSQSVACLLIILTASFAEFLILMKSHLSIFSHGLGF